MAELPGPFCSLEELADYYVGLRKKHADRPSSRWLFKIKELRARHNLSILEAERLALNDPAMRRWALRMMNSNPQCRKTAHQHIRYNGEASLLERDGSGYRYRDTGEV